MNLEVTNREFLREFKKLKKKLIKGEVDQISINQPKEGVILDVVVRVPTTHLQRFLQKVKTHGPIHIVRPEEDLF